MGLSEDYTVHVRCDPLDGVVALASFGLNLVLGPCLAPFTTTIHQHPNYLIHRALLYICHT